MLRGSDDVLAAWEAETPVPEDVKRRVDAKFDAVFGPDTDRRMAG